MLMPVYGKALVIWITLACSMGFLLFGYDQGVMSGIIGANNQFGNDFNHPDPDLQGTIVAIYEIGCFFGAMFIFVFGEKLGRRHAIILGGLVMIVGAIIQASAFHVSQLIVGRIVAGLGNGANTATIPIWQSETCMPKERGKLVCIECVILILGVVISYWMDYGFSNVNGPAQWRFPVGFQAFFAIVLVILVLVLPESPRWLIRQGRKAEATDVLQRLTGKNVPADDPRVVKLRNEIEEIVKEEAGEQADFSYRELFTGGKIQNFRRIMLCWAVQAFQQLSGINLITYYAPVIFNTSIGLSRNVSLILGGFNGVEYCLASLIPVFIIDRVGRRPLMLFSAAGQTICMAVLAITVHNGSKPAGEAAASMLFLFNTVFAVGWLAIPWLYPAEVTTLRIRSKGAACATMSNWIFNFLVVKVTPSAINQIGYKTYIIFAVFNLWFIPMVYFFFPETANVPLEDVDYLFDTTRKFTAGATERQRERDARIDREKMSIERMERRASESTMVEAGKKDITEKETV